MSKLRLVHDRDRLEIEDIAGQLQTQISARAKTRHEEHKYERHLAIIKNNLRGMASIAGVQAAADDLVKIVNELSRELSK